ncbi:MAG: Uncharacterised protein [Porticoccaceae bacterium UBA1117]|nr:MAG: Uncharacterised protein [Porticoccaceae bacterium UBA1117]
MTFDSAMTAASLILAACAAIGLVALYQNPLMEIYLSGWSLC